jgi:cyanophycin synthetase
VLIEEQIPGDNYRLLYFDGKLLDAVQRKSPSVIADGRSSVAGLIRSLNARRAEQNQFAVSSHAQITVDLDLKNTLKLQNLSMKSVPPAGQVVRLKTASNENSADENVTVTHEIHHSIVDAGARAARASKLRLAGVDLVLADHTRPLEETGGVILEVNSPPGYFWHYRKAGQVCRVGVPVLRELFKVQMERSKTI